MILQLSTLALINHCNPGHYLYASAAAVELTVLHNFTWHLHYTWRDRVRRSSALTQLARFQVSNGIVSLTGNLLLTGLFVQHAHLPLLIANLLAIVCCSILNFCLGDVWIFREVHSSPDQL